MAERRFSNSMRWLAGCVLLACFAVAVIQWRSLSILQHENQALRQEQEEVQRLRRENEEAHRSPNQAQEMERLRADNQDLLKLRNEVSRLRQQVKEMEKVRAENRRLQAEYEARLAQLQQQTPAAPAPAPAPVSSDRAEWIACINNLKQIGLAARLWANDHNNVLPPDFLAMKPEVGTPKILVCPADKTKPHPDSVNWEQFEAKDITYQMVAPGVSAGEPGRAFVQCPGHGHVCYVDGSVVAGPTKP